MYSSPSKQHLFLHIANMFCHLPLATCQLVSKNVQPIHITLEMFAETLDNLKHSVQLNPKKRKSYNNKAATHLLFYLFYF